MRGHLLESSPEHTLTACPSKIGDRRLREEYTACSSGRRKQEKKISTITVYSRVKQKIDQFLAGANYGIILRSTIETKFINNGTVHTQW